MCDRAERWGAAMPKVDFNKYLEATCFLRTWTFFSLSGETTKMANFTFWRRSGVSCRHVVMEDDGWSAELRDDVRFWVLHVCTPVVFIVGLVGNGVTIVVLSRKRMKSSTNIYLTALAIADLFYLFFSLVLSFWHVDYFHEPEFLPLWQMWGTILWITDACS